MSGIVALVSCEAPPNPALPERMSEALRPFGPDGETRWSDREATLAVHWLRARERETRPPLAASADGRTIVVADARIDDRASLCRQLGSAYGPDASDAELILAAYLTWGEHCAEHLRGDFAFVVWDAPRRRLVCARDPFGVRPLFVARTAAALIVASAVDAIRAHPAVSDTLDDRAIADFLIAGYPLDVDATVFEAVRAVPPGHTLELRSGGVRTVSTWTIEAGPEIHYRRPEDYGEHFREVLGAAVADRLAGATTAILMSGGRDSVGVAAAAREVAPEERLIAITTGYARLMPDRDPHYARVAARALGIDQRMAMLDEYRNFGAWLDPAFRTAEPTSNYTIELERDVYAAAATEARVVLTGQGADAVFRESRAHLARLVTGGHWLRAAREAAEYLRVHRRVPRPGVRTLREDRRGWQTTVPTFPAWLRPSLADRLSLHERWLDMHRPPGVDYAPHSGMLDSLRKNLWPHVFEAYHPPLSGVAMEVATPYFDLRVIDFLLRVPPAQWNNDKGLLRMLLGASMPPEFLRRQKYWLPAEPLAARMRAEHATGWRPPFPVGASVDRWVDRSSLPRWAGGGRHAPMDEAWLHFRPLALSLWLDRSG